VRRQIDRNYKRASEKASNPVSSRRRCVLLETTVARPLWTRRASEGAEARSRLTGIQGRVQSAKPGSIPAPDF